MTPLAGYVVDVGKGVISVKLETGNTRKIRTEAKFKYGDKVRVNFNYKEKTVRSVKHWDTPLDGTVKCDRCSRTSMSLGDDLIEDIYR